MRYYKGELHHSITKQRQPSDTARHAIVISPLAPQFTTAPALPSPAHLCQGQQHLVRGDRRCRGRGSIPQSRTGLYPRQDGQKTEEGQRLAGNEEWQSLGVRNEEWQGMRRGDYHWKCGLGQKGKRTDKLVQFSSRSVTPVAC